MTRRKKIAIALYLVYVLATVGSAWLLFILRNDFNWIAGGIRELLTGIIISLTILFVIAGSIYLVKRKDKQKIIYLLIGISPCFVAIPFFKSPIYQPVKAFRINSDVQHIHLKLYADSTFVEEVEEIEDSYSYSGNWTGSYIEDSVFTITATQKGSQIITLTPTKRFKVVNGEAVQIK